MSLEKELKKFNEGIAKQNNALENLREGILNGESTGDKLIDTSILMHESQYQPKLEVYKSKLEIIKSYLNSPFIIQSNFIYLNKHIFGGEYAECDYSNTFTLFFASPNGKFTIEPKRKEIILGGSFYDFSRETYTNEFKVDICNLENLKENQRSSYGDRTVGLTLQNLDFALELVYFPRVKSKEVFEAFGLEIPKVVHDECKKRDEKVLAQIIESKPTVSPELEKLIEKAQKLNLVSPEGIIEYNGEKIDINKIKN